MENGVDYFAFKVDKECIHPSSEKLKAMIEAPDMDQLKAVLGLLNMLKYYC